MVSVTIIPPPQHPAVAQDSAAPVGSQGQTNGEPVHDQAPVSTVEPKQRTPSAASKLTSPVSPHSAAPTNGTISSASSPVKTAIPLEQAKEDLQNSQMYTKVTTAELKAAQDKLKLAFKEGEKAQKAEAHAAKMEAKARKALNAAIQKEYKLSKELVKLKSKHEAAVVAVEKARGIVDVKEGHLRSQSEIKEQRMKDLNAARDESSNLKSNTVVVAP